MKRCLVRELTYIPCAPENATWGFAGAVASVIDDNIHDGILGTIAGDDAVLVILREHADVRQLVQEISRYIGGFASKLVENS